MLVELRAEPPPDDEWLHLFSLAYEHVGKLKYERDEKHPSFMEDIVALECREENLQDFVKWLCAAVQDTSDRADRSAVSDDDTPAAEVADLLQQIRTSLDE